jgi:hypothetical protein
MPNKRDLDTDQVLKVVLVGVIVIAILSSFIFLFSLGKASSLAGEAIDVLTGIRQDQIEGMSEGGFEEREYCSATVVKTGDEKAVFLYNCQSMP